VGVVLSLGRRRVRPPFLGSLKSKPPPVLVPHLPCKPLVRPALDLLQDPQAITGRPSQGAVLVTHPHPGTQVGRDGGEAGGLANARDGPAAAPSSAPTAKRPGAPRWGTRTTAAAHGLHKKEMALQVVGDVGALRVWRPTAQPSAEGAARAATVGFFGMTRTRPDQPNQRRAWTSSRES
jgi:hypothetical protein